VARLIVMNGPLAGRRVEVDSELVIGRFEADLTIEDERVSRRHAAVRPVAGGLEIEDLGSLNGTWVNGSRSNGPTRLGPGDVVELGRVLLGVETEAELEAGAQLELIVTNGPLAGHRFEVSSALVIGRVNADLTIEDEWISRRHAIVRPAAGGIEVEDLGSLNGTWLNGRRIEAPTRVEPGDVIALGGEVAIEVKEKASGRAAPPVGAAATVAVAAPWQTFEGKRVTVHAPEGSYAATRAPVELREAERSLAALEDLLRPPSDAERVGRPAGGARGACDLATGAAPDRPLVRPRPGLRHRSDHGDCRGRRGACRHGPDARGAARSDPGAT
jgi:pSer/pThr/pTyr-binding forkhead associated (FHA) protein